jgi:lantibiotic transport system ATP-binding protein
MNSLLIQTNALRYSFSKEVTVLNDINMQVPAKSIYGFLGPNGAGKTTTLRLLLGLLKKQQGSIEIFGKELQSDKINILKKIGSLIEQPSIYGHLTARENLEVYRKLYGAGKERIEEVLKLVNLTYTKNKKAKQFSLGMKQRLSIAIALLPKPELLVLDEPTNGLDPNGIIEVRELIKTLNKEQGVTVLVSSHILAEVEKMATHVGIIHKGKLVFQGGLQDLQQLKHKQSFLEVETTDNDVAVQLLREFGAERQNGHLVLPFTNKLQSASINRMLIEKGIDVYRMHPQQNDLEKLFLDITSDKL